MDSLREKKQRKRRYLSLLNLEVLRPRQERRISPRPRLSGSWNHGDDKRILQRCSAPNEQISTDRMHGERMRVAAFLIATACVFRTSPTAAQQFDPRPSLTNIITAFQRCGPPQAYAVLAPYLFQVVAQQTGGAGCYQAIQAAGPVVHMEVIDSRSFPIGPLYIVRVTHSAGVVADWFIGFNQITGQIEYLSYQAATGSVRPTVQAGPDPDKNLGGVKPPETKPDSSGDKRSPGCQKFPEMCP
jgi:hypothetical protein